jgi:hypothetical protein
MTMLGAMFAPTGPAYAEDKPAWDKTFPKSDQVTHQKVEFKDRYGITLAADLYQPKDRGDKRLPAIAVSGPFQQGSAHKANSHMTIVATGSSPLEYYHYE